MEEKEKAELLQFSWKPFQILSHVTNRCFNTDIESNVIVKTSGISEFNMALGFSTNLIYKRNFLFQ